MTDLIDRQAAIGRIRGTGYADQIKENVIMILMGAPSAQPEIVRCRECKYHDGIRCFRWNSVIITGFDDFCSNGERRSEDE